MCVCRAIMLWDEYDYIIQHKRLIIVMRIYVPHGLVYTYTDTSVHQLLSMSKTLSYLIPDRFMNLSNELELIMIVKSHCQRVRSTVTSAVMFPWWLNHYDDVIMNAIASQITSLTIVYSIVYSDADQRKHQSSASLAFVWGIHRGPVNSPHKWPVTRKMFPFDDVIMWVEQVPH